MASSPILSIRVFTCNGLKVEIISEPISCRSLKVHFSIGFVLMYSIVKYVIFIQIKNILKNK